MHGDRLHVGITMTTSPVFGEHRIDQTASRPATLDKADTDGDARFMDVKERGTERRRKPPPSTPDGYLHELPALILLDRLRTPMLATGLDGVLIYTNPAFATMLGYPDATTLTEQPLPALLAGHSATPPRDCVTALRAAGTVVIDWLHTEGFPVRTVVSDALLVRATDGILLISITDITELMWTTPTLPAVARPAPAAPPKHVEPQHIGTQPQRAKTVDAHQHPTDRNPLCHNMLYAFPH
jgi:PAS domain-containing protein